MSDKIQNLSDAIRMGAALTKPGGIGYLCDRAANSPGKVTSTCALGAGMFAILGHEMHRNMTWTNVLLERFPWLDGMWIWFENRKSWLTWDDWVWRNYDYGLKTREQIAKELQEMGL